MSWGAAFRLKLAGVFTPRFRIEWTRFNSESGAAITLSSESGAPRIGRVRVDGMEINPHTLGVTWGRCVVELFSDVSSLRACVTQGGFLSVYVGLEGYAAADFELLFVGAIRALTMEDGPTWKLELIDMATALRQRPTNVVAESQLFHTIGVDGYPTGGPSTTTLSANYTAGSGTLLVGSTTGATYQDSAGGSYIGLLVTPSSGDPFYAVATGSTGTSYTGVTGGAFDTTDTNASSGDDVQNIALIRSHPITVALRVLTSGKGGSNGTYDTLPSSWGLSVPVGFVDVDDAENWRDVVGQPASGSFTANVMATEAQDDAIAWMTTWLNACGCYLATRMGKLTVRAWQPSAVPIGEVGTTWTVTDADMVAPPKHEWWYDGQDVEYAAVIAKCSTVSTSRSSTYVHHRPSQPTRTFDMSTLVFANETAVADSVSLRMKEAALRKPEAITLRLRGMHWAAASVGDGCRITSSLLTSRLEAGDFNDRRGVIVRVSGLWGEEPVSELKVLVYPAEGATWE